MHNLGSRGSRPSTVGIVVLAVIILLIAGFFTHKARKEGKQGKRIDETENIVTEIRKLSEFTTACYYEETVIRKPKGKKKEIVLIVKGKVRAGFDLSQLSDSAVSVRGDSLFIAIPPAKVLEVIVNPSDVETFVEKGSWSQQETNELVRIASQHIQDNAVKHKLLEKAEKVGRDKLKEFFKVLHYRYVKIEKPVTETE